jgi:DNA-binding LacI/PurR family transcriptional regulator
VQDRLRELLADQPVGSRLPPIPDLARQLKTGQTYTYRAVRDLVSQGILVSSPRRGTFLVRSARQAARTRALASGEGPSTRTRSATSLGGKKVRLFLHRRAASDFMFSRIADAFCDAAAATGMDVQRELTEFSRLDEMHRYPDDALVLVNPGGSQSQPSQIVFGPRQVLVVVSTADVVPVAAIGRFDVVTVVQEQGAYVAGVHMRAAGVTSTCFLGVWQDGQIGRPYDLISQARLAGLQRGLGESIDPSRCLGCIAYDPAPGAMAVREFVQMLRAGQLGSRPGLFAASDDLAVGFALGAASQGMMCGVDYQLVGFDGQQVGRDLRLGALATVGVPCEQMGQKAAELLAQRLHDADRPVHRLHLGCSFLEGKTLVSP